MDGKQARYTYEQRVAAAKAVVDGGMPKGDAMARYGIMSRTPLERWCRAYRKDAAKALRPKPKEPKGYREPQQGHSRARSSSSAGYSSSKPRWRI